MAAGPSAKDRCERGDDPKRGRESTVYRGKARDLRLIAAVVPCARWETPGEKAQKMAEGSPFMFPKPTPDARPWWERVRCFASPVPPISNALPTLSRTLPHTRRTVPGGAWPGRGAQPGRWFARFGTRETLKWGRCFGDVAAASVQAHASSPHPPFPPLRRKRLNIALALAQVDAEHSIESGQSDNFVTWHIRQFMDDPAKTTSLFYQHVADRKAAAEQVYAPRPPRRPPLAALLRVLFRLLLLLCLRGGAPRNTLAQFWGLSLDAILALPVVHPQCDPARPAHQDGRVLAAAAEQLVHHPLPRGQEQPVRGRRGELGEALLRGCWLPCAIYKRVLSFELIAVVWKPIDEADLEATPRCIALGCGRTYRTYQRAGPSSRGGGGREARRKGGAEGL